MVKLYGTCLLDKDFVKQATIINRAGTGNECDIFIGNTLLQNMDSCMPSTRLPAGTGNTSSLQSVLSS